MVLLTGNNGVTAVHAIHVVQCASGQKRTCNFRSNIYFILNFYFVTLFFTIILNFMIFLI